MTTMLRSFLDRRWSVRFNYFAPMPWNFLGKEFRNTYVGGVGPSVIF